MKKTLKRIINTVTSLKNRVFNKCKAGLRRYKNHRCNVAIRKRKGKLLTVDTADMFFIQVNGRELMRYDMVVRYLAVENYYGENDYGFTIYKKMQDSRMGVGYGEKAVEQFKQLIQSYEKNGYDEQSFIVADKNLKLIDGSHRMALALYHHIDKITVLEIGMAHPVNYSIDWFFQKGFLNEEIDLIIAKGEQLICENSKPFSCIIWSPAFSLKEKIIKDLGYYGQVGACKSYHFLPAEYENIVRAIYAIDDIEKWKIDKKLEYMGENACEAVEVELFYDNPVYRIKKATGMPLSSYSERVKKTIRGRYKPYIENYFFDIILHIGDSYLQSDYMHKVFEPGIRFREVLDILDKYQYALIKVDVPYMPEEFPDRIPVGEDIDILSSRDSFVNLKKQLTEYVKQYQEYEINILDSSNCLRIRFELSGKLIFQIDCRCEYECIPDEFLDLALLSRHKEKDYYVLDSAFEAIIRRAAYGAKPSAQYHKEYYEKYKTEDCVNMFNKYTGGGIIDEDLLIEFFEYLDSKGIPHDKACIVGSAMLGILGIRKSRDLDFILSSEYADQYPDKVTKVTPSGNIEKVRKNWCRNNQQTIFSDDEIIDDPRLHFNYKGTKVAVLQLLIYKKSILRREKDLQDLKIIQDYIVNQ